MQLRLWSGAVNPIGTCTENYNDKQPVRLFLTFRRHAKVVTHVPPTTTSLASPVGLNQTPAAVLAQVNRDSLSLLDELAKPLIWQHRWSLAGQVCAVVDEFVFTQTQRTCVAAAARVGQSVAVRPVVGSKPG